MGESLLVTCVIIAAVAYLVVSFRKKLRALSRGRSGCNGCGCEERTEK